MISNKIIFAIALMALAIAIDACENTIMKENDKIAIVLMVINIVSFYILI